MNSYKTVDEYIAAAPKNLQEKLKQLRLVIKEIAPKALETISYSMPFYSYKGRLVYFACAKHHIGLYIPPPIIGDHAQQLKEYVTSKSAIQFPLDQDLPVELIKKLLKARIMYNEKNEKK